MARRNLLAISKLDSFKDYLVNIGFEIYEPKGFYEVLRAKRDRRWVIVYRKLELKNHYSILDKDVQFVRQFIKESRD